MSELSRNRIVLWILGLGLFLVPAGCGSSGGSGSTPSSPPLTKAQYLKQGNAICRHRLAEKDQRVLATMKKRGKAFLDATPRELEELGSNLVFPIYGEVVSDLQALTPPPGDKAAVEKILGQYEAALQEVEDKPGILVEGQTPFVKANEAASAYGLSACTFY